MENEPQNCPECGWLNGQCDCDGEPPVRSSELVGRDGQKPKINPEYLKATHLILWMYPGAPSFEEQIRHDQEVQEQLEKEMREASNAPHELPARTTKDHE